MWQWTALVWISVRLPICLLICDPLRSVTAERQWQQVNITISLEAEQELSQRRDEQLFWDYMQQSGSLQARVTSISFLPENPWALTDIQRAVCRAANQVVAPRAASTLSCPVATESPPSFDVDLLIRGRLSRALHWQPCLRLVEDDPGQAGTSYFQGVLRIPGSYGIKRNVLQDRAGCRHVPRFLVKDTPNVTCFGRNSRARPWVRRLPCRTRFRARVRSKGRICKRKGLARSIAAALAGVWRSLSCSPYLLHILPYCRRAPASVSPEYPNSPRSCLCHSGSRHASNTSSTQPGPKSGSSGGGRCGLRSLVLLLCQSSGAGVRVGVPSCRTDRT